MSVKTLVPPAERKHAPAVAVESSWEDPSGALLAQIEGFRRVARAAAERAKNEQAEQELQYRRNGSGQ